MSKIVQAVNSMISNQKLITNVIQGDKELFFLYKGKYKWSVNGRAPDKDCLIFYYPGDEPLEVLASFENDDWEGTPMIVYRASELGTKEAKASFLELSNIIKEKLYGVNDVLDDIISDDIPF
jgi:hypothetical protein